MVERDAQNVVLKEPLQTGYSNVKKISDAVSKAISRILLTENEKGEQWFKLE